MKRRIALMVWSCLSPIAWIVMIFIVVGSKTSNITVAIIVSVFTFISLLGSFLAAIEFSRGEHFFKTQDELDKEIEKYIKVRSKYQKLIEQSAQL